MVMKEFFELLERLEEKLDRQQDMMETVIDQIALLDALIDERRVV